MNWWMAATAILGLLCIAQLYFINGLMKYSDRLNSLLEKQEEQYEMLRNEYDNQYLDAQTWRKKCSLLEDELVDEKDLEEVYKSLGVKDIP
jgi:hypothetical protein